MVEVSPDGKHVYVTAIESDTFLIFNRNAASGIVTLANAWTDGENGVVTGLNYPYGIAVSPDGRFIYVTSFNSTAVVTFYRAADDAILYQGALVDNTNLINPYIPVLSPDGQHLYVTGGHTGAVTDPGYVSVFSRDALTGALTFVERRYEGQLISCPIICFYINGLSGAWGIAVSPDGQYVYVAGYQDDSIVRFLRNPEDGTLVYGGRVTDSLALAEELAAAPETAEGVAAAEAVAVAGLDGAFDVKLSPDGLYLYATGNIADAVSVFGRNASGVLTQVQIITPTAGLPALDGARELVVSPDGTAVYATGGNADSVVAFHTANPVPTLSSLLPASAAAGTPNLVVRVQGEHFVPGAVVQVGGADRPTEFVHPGELEVQLAAGDLSAAGTLTLAVVNPAPGGGLSLNSLPFSVTAPGENPLPAIDYLLPAGAAAGDPALALRVIGLNFVNGAVVRWNGADLATVFVNGTELRFGITAVELQAVGAAVVTVFNPGPGGGLSNAVAFDVAAPGQNPVPSLLAVDPYQILARGAGSVQVPVRVTGENFVLGAVAQWNGQDRPTQVVSETEVRVTLTSLDVAFGGSGAITVTNPGPGGGTSNALTFAIHPYGLFFPSVQR
jgi:DNA-binding beta-propeller fold protein YncE